MTDPTSKPLGGYCEEHKALWYGSGGCEQCGPNAVAYQEREAVRELPGVIEARAHVWSRAHADFFGVLMRGEVPDKKIVTLNEARKLAAQVADDAVEDFNKRFGGLK